MSKLQVGYKLLDKHLGSCTRVSNGPGYVKYSKNKFVGPRKGCGDLCVFTNKETAFKFRDWVESEGPVWMCVYVLSDSKYIWVGESDSKTEIEDFQTLFPEAVLAKKVRLIEEVKY